MLKKVQPILYFTRGIAATAEDVKAIEALQHGFVPVRNGGVKPGDVLEQAIAVAGYPPEAYAKAYPLVRTHEDVLRVLEGEPLTAKAKGPAVSQPEPPKRSRKTVTPAKANKPPKRQPNWTTNV